MNFSKKKTIQRVCIVSILTLAILLSCIGIIFGQSNTAEALKLTDGKISSTEAIDFGKLLLDGYDTDTTGTGKVFNGAVLLDLLKSITGRTNLSLTEIATLSDTKNSDDIRNMEVSGVRINDGKDLYVDINGLKWMPTYLSTNLTGEPILTFWLATSEENNVKTAYAQTSLTNSKGKYPSSMYGTSYLRASILNNGGGYAASYNASSLTNAPQSSSSDWAIYTMTKVQNVAGSIEEFIEVPNNVSWQRNQRAKDYVTSSAYTTSYNYNNNGDALYEGGNSSECGNWYSDSTVNRAGYQLWGADSLWIPSIAETGVNGVEGLWKLSNNQRANNSGTWTRSARYFNFDCVYALSTTGTGMGVGNVGPAGSGSAYAVRPAFHLNLKKVASRIGFEQPSDVEIEYNGLKQGLSDIEDTTKTIWYNTDYMTSPSCSTDMKSAMTHQVTVKLTSDVIADGGVFAGTPDINKGEDNVTRKFEFKITPKPLGVSWSTSEEGIAVPSLIDSQFCSNASGVKDTVKLNLNYTGRNSNAGYDSTTVPRVIGDYTVTITSLSNTNYTLDETAVDSQDFTKTETNIPVPTFFPNSWYNYNGSVRTYELELGGDFKGDYTVHVPTEFTSKYDLNKTVTTDGTVTVKATKAGTYELELRLTDTANTQWKLSDGTVTKDSQKIQFKVQPLPLELQIETDTNTIDCELEEDFDLYVQAQTRPKSGESVLLDFYVQRVGSESETLVYSDFAFDSTMSDFTIKLKLSEVEIPSNYKLVIKVKNSDGSSDYVNYETILDDIIFNIKEKVDVNSTIFWQLRINGAIKTSMYFDIDIDYTPEFDKIPLIYSGKEYSFTASLPSGYSVDRTYSVDGFTNGYKDAKFTNAGEYTTTARVNTPDGTKEYSIKWTIEQAKFDLSGVKWQYDGQLPYDKVNGSEAILDPKTLPAGLIPNYSNNTGTTVGTSGSASVTFTLASGYEDNYVLPDESDKDGYVDPGDDFEWSKPWNIVKATIQSSSWKNSTAMDSNNHAYSVPILRDPNADGDIVEYEYYETDSMGNILDATNPLKQSDIVWSASESKFYVAKPILIDTDNYELDSIDAQSKVFRVGKDLTKVSVSLEKTQMEYNTNPRHAKVKVAGSALPTTAFDLIYYDGYTRLSNAPTEVGTYRVEVSLKNAYMDKYQIDGDYEFDYEIVKAKISTEWNENAKPPVLKLTYGQINGVEYEIIDGGENLVEYKNLKAGVTYKIRARIKDNQLDKFIFDDESTETDWKTFSVTANDLDNLKDPNSPDNPAYPQEDPELPTQDQDPTDPNGTGSGNDPGSGNEGGSGSLGDILEKLKDIPLWQLIASVISIILIIIFLSKTAGYEGKRKKFKKKTEKLESMYAGAFLGLAMSIWTAIACVLIGLAVMSFVMMLIAKSRCNKAEEAYEDGLDEYNRNKQDEEKQEARQRDENMRMMFMGMGGQGGMAQGMPQGYAYQPAFGIDDMRGLISETVTAMLPGMQQLLPQQASSNDEVIKSLVEEQKAMRDLMQKLADQPTEKVVEREVAATSVNDETIKQMMKNQEMLMEKILELSANQNGGTQIIEKEVPVEKVVEKIVEVPVEKIVEVPVEVEKIVEKEVVKEVPVEVEKIVEKEVKVEVPVEVEKIVEKEVVKEIKVEVPVAVPTPSKPKKEVAPRLTLDEAYAGLSKQQQKYFDGLRQYALSKPNSKEKKSTYFTVFGQSTVNPLMKLTIKKDTVVALFKMEDEYLKDIKRDATSDGTKIKVKETEVMITDAQACKAAKNMIDLREDQIERYQDLLKEQRAMKNKK